MEVDSPDVVIAKRLLDHARLRGFTFQRAAPGQDGPLVGHRVSGGWVDVIRIAGFSRDCLAVRRRTSALIVVENGPVQRRVEGSALDVLNEVLTWESPPHPGAP
ncbi:MAG: hypothetical protein ACRDSR_13725 [Pseudonocardiaceae bacterium]